MCKTIPKGVRKNFKIFILTLSGPGGGDSEARMAKLTAANQNLENEKIFLFLEIAEIDMGGQCWVERTDS